MVEGATSTRVDELLGIGPETGEQLAGDVVGSDQQDAPHTGIFNNAQYIIINGGSFYDVRGNVSHVTGFSGMTRERLEPSRRCTRVRSYRVHH